ncbi:DUF5079 family protein [Staphylococcus simulans]|uniref:DUF5079 family protein n=1 Tax=Staphylococcus simulans TaxID=1286 RepID=UPI00399AFA8C
MTKRKEKNIYESLRTPGTQVLSLLTLFLMLFTGLMFFFGLKLENIPKYLFISTSIQIIIALAGFIPLFFREKPKVYKKFIRRLSIFAVLCVVSAYNTTFATYNIYFYLAAQHGIDLFKFWIIGTLTMLICFGFQLIQQFILYRDPEKFNGKSEKDRFFNKMIYLLVFRALRYLVIVQKIIEYFMIPNIADSRFTIMLVAMLIYGAMAFCTIVSGQSALAFIEFNEEEHSNGTRRTNHA